MKILLRMKAWQHFAIIILIFAAFSCTADMNNTTEQNLIPLLTESSISLIVLLSYLMLYFWSVGKELERHIPDNAKMGNKMFLFSAIYVVMYQFIFVVSAILLVKNKDLAHPAILLSILLSMLFWVYCYYYTISHVAKSLVVAEENKGISEYDYTTTRSQFFVYFIGIWQVHPRIQKLIGIK